MLKKLLSVIPWISFRRKAKPEKAVILIHGLWMNHWIMHYLGWHFRRKGFAVHYFNYPSLKQDIETNVLQLDRTIQQIDSKELFLVGHSLGGLICLEYLRQFHPVQMKRCVLLGSPINGSEVAINLSTSRLGKWLLGQSASALIKKHSFDVTNKLGVIIGTGGKGLGQVFSPLHRPHDGAVAVREARLESIEHQLILPVSHSSMLFSKPVVCATVQFCLTGSFSAE